MNSNDNKQQGTFNQYTGKPIATIIESGNKMGFNIGIVHLC